MLSKLLNRIRRRTQKPVGFAEWELTLMAQVRPETRKRIFAALDNTNPMTQEEWDALLNKTE